MKKIILIFFLAIMLTGCFSESRDGCPQDLHLVFDLKDEYEPGDFDSRIAADVILFIFNDKRFVASIPISYDKISSRKKYVIRKDESLVGNVELVAWSASAIEGYDESVPIEGSDIDNLTLGLEPMANIDSYYYPAKCGLYMGIEQVNEKIDHASTHLVELIHSTCRVEVNVTDIAGKLGNGGNGPSVNVYGSMSNMNMSLQGTGREAVVKTSLENDQADRFYFSTGRFGIMPSSADQTLSVEIVSDQQEVLAVLSVPNSALPTGARAGSLVIFDYVIGEAEFQVTIDGFTHKVIIIDGV